MGRIGNASVSSLISGARAARTQQQNVDDAYHAYDFDSSEQTPEQLAAYNAYLQSRAQETVDPAKSLAIQKKMDSAQTSFTQNEIQREGDRVITGESSLRDKFNKVQQLYQQARTPAAQQNLYSQLLSLDKQIQEQDASNASKAQAASEKAYNQSTTANAHQIENTIGDSKTLEKMYNDKLRNGEMSLTEYHEKIGKLYQARDAIYTSAQNGEYGDLTPDKVDKYTSDQQDMQMDAKYQTAMTKANKALNGDTNEVLAYDAATDSFKPSTSGVKSLQTIGPDGRATGLSKFGYDNYSEPKKDTKSDRISKASKGEQFVLEQRVGGDVTHVGYARNYDPATGQTYIVDQRNVTLPNGKSVKGLPHYINNDPNAALQLSQSAFTAEDAKAGHKVNAADVYGQYFNDAVHGHLLDGVHPSDMLHGMRGVSASRAAHLGSSILGGISPLFGGLGHMASGLISRPPVPVMAQKSTPQVMSPAAVAAKTPAVAVRPIAPTPRVVVASPAKVAASTPSVSVKPIAPTPSVKVVGPKPAPAPAKTKPWWHFW